MFELFAEKKGTFSSIKSTLNDRHRSGHKMRSVCFTLSSVFKKSRIPIIPLGLQGTYGGVLSSQKTFNIGSIFSSSFRKAAEIVSDHRG